MRIVIDMQGAQTESRFRGIGRYTIAMTQALLRLQTEHDILLAFNGLMPESIASVRQAVGDLIQDKNVLVWHAYGPVRDDDGRHSWHRQVAQECYKTFLQDLRADLLFISSYFEGYRENAVACVAEPVFGFATCVVVYDLIPLLNAEQYFVDTVYAQHYTRKLAEIQSAAGALTISEFSRDEALAHLSFRPEQIVNTYLGADAQFRPLSLDNRQRQARMREFQLDRPFVLYTGGADERKNLPRLVQAFAALPLQLRQQHQLLFAGKFSSTETASLQSLGRELKLEPDALRFTGYVSDQTLIELYNLCALFVFPSWHEGFGLPVLEAMACGAPALAGHRSSLSEVLDYQDALFDPFDAQDISEKMARFLQNATLRTSLVEHSLSQARRFSWEASARAAMSQFERVLRQQPARLSQTHTEVEAELQSNYQALVGRIAELSVDASDIQEHDFMLVARCIEANQIEARRIRFQVNVSDSSAWYIETQRVEPRAQASLERLSDALAKRGRHLVPVKTDADLCVQALPHIDMIGEETAVLQRVPLQFSYGLRLGQSAAPQAWVKSLNQSVRGVLVQSEQLRKSLIDSGVYVPIRVCQTIIEDWSVAPQSPSELEQAKSFRFVCDCSGAFGIKQVGLDVLLTSYGDTFSAADEVSLLLLVEDALVDEIEDSLAHWRRDVEGRPHVLVLRSVDMPRRQSIYQAAHCLVMPYRYEDVGIPVARAVAIGLPVLTTAWGGQTEVACPTNTTFVDYHFAYAQDTEGQFDLYWAEPDSRQLAERMRAHFNAQTPRHGQSLRSTVPRSWLDVTQDIERDVRVWSQDPVLRRPRIGWISTWNARCGIAAYSEHLIEHVPEPVMVFAPKNVEQLTADDGQVVRCWEMTQDDLIELSAQLAKHAIDTLVIQFNYGFFDFAAFAEFLASLAARQVKVVVTMHSTTDLAHAPDRRLSQLIPSLSLCHRVLVHSIGDLNRLKHLGLTANVALFPLGVKDVTQLRSSTKHEVDSELIRRKRSMPFEIATYGFFLPHKGLLEMVETIGLLRVAGIDVKMHMVNAEYPIGDSAALVRQARTKINALGLSEYIRLTTDFLPDEDSLGFLSQADLIVYPYQQTGESASGAVRFGLASMQPVAVTPLAIFDDVSPAVHRLPGFAPEQLANGLKALIEDLRNSTTQINKTRQIAEAWCAAHRYPSMAIRMLNILKAPMR